MNEFKNKIELLNFELEDKNSEIEKLKKSGGGHKTKIEIVKEAPKIMRIKQPPIKEIVYEKDPFIVEQNKQLSLKLDEALAEEQNVKNPEKNFLNFF